MKHLCTLLLMVCITTSCDQIKSIFGEEKPADPSLVQRFYKNGTLKSEVRVDENNKRHGLGKTYYPSGKPKSEINYEHGVKTNAVQFYEDGVKYLEFNYKNGKKHGKRTKYWETGEVRSILEYDDDRPGIGLKEYNKKGQLLTKYPELIIRQTDKLNLTGEYIIEVFFDKNTSRGDYYMGKLKGGFLPSTYSKMNEVNGKGRFVYRPLPGTFKMEKMYFVGKFKTLYGNPYLVEKSINLAIDF
ncbi:MAG: hypothetical protein ABJP45_01320 [Cyclobacteriaceae bacterium]